MNEKFVDTTRLRESSGFEWQHKYVLRHHEWRDDNDDDRNTKALPGIGASTMGEVVLLHDNFHTNLYYVIKLMS